MRAKGLLKRKEVPFKEIDISGSPEQRSEMMKRANGRYTVPQIFIGERHIGGSDELHVLEAKGELDPILQNQAQ